MFQKNRPTWRRRWWLYWSILLFLTSRKFLLLFIIFFNYSYFSSIIQITSLTTKIVNINFVCCHVVCAKKKNLTDFLNYFLYKNDFDFPAYLIMQSARKRTKISWNHTYRSCCWFFLMKCPCWWNGNHFRCGWSFVFLTRCH